MSKEEMA